MSELEISRLRVEYNQERTVCRERAYVAEAKLKWDVGNG